MADRYAPSDETLEILKSTKLATETFLGYQNKNEDISCCIFSPIHEKVPLMSCEGLLLPVCRSDGVEERIVVSWWEVCLVTGRHQQCEQ